MKKIAKLSLVAAVAVSGLTTVNAASLEEAIKGVDVSGQFRFRYQEISTGDSGSDVEVEVGVKVPVTDNVTAVFKIDNAGNDADNAIDRDNVAIEDYYFSYVNGALTVNAGHHNIAGRITDGGQGNGITALYNLGNFTVGAVAYDNALVDGTTYNQMLTSVIAMGNIGPVSVLGQYADLADTLDAYNVKADANVGPVKLGVEYTETELDGSSDDRNTFKAYVSGKAGIVSAKLSYAKTGDQGSGSIAEELEAASESLLWNVGSAGRDDFDAFTIDASVAVSDKISLRAAHTAGEQGNGANNDVTETLGQISYKVAKNLNTYVRYADVEDQGTDYTRGRVEVKYSF